MTTGHRHGGMGTRHIAEGQRGAASASVSCGFRLHNRLSGSVIINNSACASRLLYRGVMKAGFKSNVEFLKRACARLGKQGDTSQGRAPFCYTFIRDPVSRFFSQYAEVSERAFRC